MNHQNPLIQQAIQAALANNWTEAIELNLQIIKKEPQNIEALSRLAKAYLQLNQKKIARKTYLKVLRLDRFNPIAKTQLEQLKNHKTSVKKQKKHPPLSPNLFLEEAGKTKEIILVSLGKEKSLLSLSVGDPVKIVVRKKSISIYSQLDELLGKIPDDLVPRLIRLIKNGNQYQAWVKSVTSKSLSIFVRESKQGPKNQTTPSFPSSGEKYQSSALPNMIQQEPLEEMENPQD